MKLSKTESGNATSIAFLTFEHEFHNNWEKFKKIMEKNPSIKYANNFNVDDPIGATWEGLVFTDGLHPRLARGVIGRFKKLISSGIYSFWAKWDRIRFSQSGLQSCKKVANREILKPGPLSFDNSGTPWLIRGQIIAWTSAMLVVMMENIVSRLCLCRSVL